jgi:hypothetical protein
MHRIVWCATGFCPVPQEDRRLQRSTAPNPNGRLTWHAPDSFPNIDVFRISMITILYRFHLETKLRQINHRVSCDLALLFVFLSSLKFSCIDLHLHSILLQKLILHIHIGNDLSCSNIEIGSSWVF